MTTFARGAVVACVFFALTTIDALAASLTTIKADIYYINWGALTRGRLTIDRVRQNPMVKTTLLDAHEASSLERWLDLDAMRGRSGALERDVRLVIDLYDRDGVRRTYYSDGRMLIAEDGSSWREVDRSFLERFTFARTW